MSNNCTWLPLHPYPYPSEVKNLSRRATDKWRRSGLEHHQTPEGGGRPFQGLRPPPNSHSTILHCVAQIDIIFAIVLSLLSSTLSSSSSLVQSVFSVSSSSVYLFTGYNNVYGANYLIDYSHSDLSFAHMIRRIRHFSYSPCEDLISYLSCL